MLRCVSPSFEDYVQYVQLAQNFVKKCLICLLDCMHRRLVISQGIGVVEEVGGVVVVLVVVTMEGVMATVGGAGGGLFLVGPYRWHLRRLKCYSW